MVLPIVKYGHPVLRQRGAKIAAVTPEIHALAADMIETMRAANGPQGPQGDQGPEGPQGPPGEVTSQQLTDAIGGTSNNTNAVALLDTASFSDPPTLSDLLAVANKLNELINAQRR